ncbi:SRPBCC family protein [Actinoplanes couchii]|nr:SRPBCC family protein [Actinoplanes couchii]MDR6318307.1 hypothetical protein [Actinoplanes couchii]
MRLESSIVVAQGADQVWEFLADPVRTTPRWDRSIAEVIPRSTGPLGVGWEATTVSPGGKRQDFRVTVWEPVSELSFALLGSPMFRHAELRFHLTGTPAGTRIDHVLDFAPRLPLLGSLLRLTSRRALDTDLALLKRALRESYEEPAEPR